MPGKVMHQLTDPWQVAFADLFNDEGIRRIQHRCVVAHVSLQRFQPSVDILGRKFRFEAL